MKKLLAITIGQAPRDDMMQQMLPYLKDFEIVQRGALDGLSKEYIIENFAPSKGDYILESKLSNGDYVNFSEEKILDRIQQILTEEENNVDLVLMLCTGVFEHEFKTKHSIIYPQKLIHPIISHLVGNTKLVVLNPSESQIPQSMEKWRKVVNNVSATFVSPYANNLKEFEDAVKFISEENPEIVFMDCMGYTENMREYFKEKTNKSVILGNVLVGKILSER